MNSESEIDEQKREERDERIKSCKWRERDRERETEREREREREHLKRFHFFFVCVLFRLI